jgi:hypothetical protein
VLNFSNHNFCLIVQIIQKYFKGEAKEATSLVRFCKLDSLWITQTSSVISDTGNISKQGNCRKAS